jgi:hypothetical protein
MTNKSPASQGQGQAEYHGQRLCVMQQPHVEEFLFVRDDA